VRVILFADIEGAAQITDYRECLPFFPDYWRSGRDKMTDDVVADAEGLLSGGASIVRVIDAHGPGGWPNLVARRSPDGATMLTGLLQPDAFDAAFRAGFHARCGTVNGFMSHIHVPAALRIKVDGSLITENHSAAWKGGVPVLGVTGDDALHRELDGTLAGTPFLSVKHSTSRTDTTPHFRDGKASAVAIRKFARQCVQEASERVSPSFPRDSLVAISTNPRAIEALAGQHGLKRTSDATVSVTGSEWRHDIRPRIGVAAMAASESLDVVLKQLDLSTYEAMQAQDPLLLGRLRDYISDWMHTLHADWED
jgi:D-aminopeptidase